MIVVTLPLSSCTCYRSAVRAVERAGVIDPEIGSGQKPLFATICFIDNHFHLVFLILLSGPQLSCP
jgi:hypothetical protein